MKKKIFFLFILSFFVLSVFADDIVISRTQLADFLEQTKIIQVIHPMICIDTMNKML